MVAALEASSPFSFPTRHPGNLKDEACSFTALCRRMSTSPKHPGATVLFLATLAAALAFEHCCGSMQGYIKLHDAVSLAMTWTRVYWRMLCQWQICKSREHFQHPAETISAHLL